MGWGEGEGCYDVPVHGDVEHDCKGKGHNLGDSDDSEKNERCGCVCVW